MERGPTCVRLLPATKSLVADLALDGLSIDLHGQSLADVL